MRDWLRKVHLWTALVVGLPLAIVAAAGFPVSYWYSSDALFAPAYYAGAPAGAPRASFDRLAAAAGNAVPGGRLDSLFLLPDYGTVQAAYTLPNGGSREAALDLATGRVIGTRVLNDAAIDWLYSVHTRFALDRVGLPRLGFWLVMAGAMTVLAASGVVLWWPRRWRWTTLAPFIRRRRVWLDLHNKAGLYALPPLLLAIGTAVLLAIPSMRGLDGETNQVVPTRSVAVAATLLIEYCATLAARQIPVSPITGVFDLSKRQLTFASGSDQAGYRWTIVDRATGRASSPMRTRPSERPMPDPLLLIGLHQGQHWGAIGQALFAVASLVPAGLYITGLTLWLTRRRSPARRG